MPRSLHDGTKKTFLFFQDSCVSPHTENNLVRVLFPLGFRCTLFFHNLFDIKSYTEKLVCLEKNSFSFLKNQDLPPRIDLVNLLTDGDEQKHVVFLL
jgi:hypothetical protein